MNFAPSPYQAAVFDFVSNGTGSAIVNAVAGAGKTTTIVKALELIPPTLKTTFLAFNKKIATELQKRVPAHVKAATFHSQGFSAWRRMHENTQIESTKTRMLLQMHFSPIDADVLGSVGSKLLSVAKSAGVGVILPDTDQTWMDLAAHYDIEFSDYPEVATRQLACARRLLQLSVDAARAPISVIDFDDMLYMPLLDNVPFYKSDWLFVDESQDTNAVQLALLRRMLKPGGRLVAVGDPKQAIYGFRGADADAMNNLRAAFNCCELPLTISYRCAQSVVRLAQTLVPCIEAAASAPEGEVLENVPVGSVKFSNGDAIICRNTAPIVELAYQLIGKGTGCRVLGREIGQALTALIGKMKAGTIEKLVEKLEAFAAREIAKYLSKGQEQKAEGTRDKVDCIMAVVNNLNENERTVSAVVKAIDAMFSDSTGGELLTLCTAHKSKGLEWDRVFIYRADLMPSKWARQAWQQEQERNLQYVAWTRAKKTLVFLTEEQARPAPKKLTARERAIAKAIAENVTLHEFWTE